MKEREAGGLKAESSKVKVKGIETEKLRGLKDEKISHRHTRTRADLKELKAEGIETEKLRGLED
jgi:hypothetical protein